jgi:pyruvate,orthophosphate dikinase
MTTQLVPFNKELLLPPEAKVKLLGGKGANLNRMTSEMGLPVPEGFTIPCMYTFYHASPNGVSDVLSLVLRNRVDKEMKNLNQKTGRKFGNPHNPLLVSVRSGAPVSMPGMMETILNLGLNDETIDGLANQTNERFAWDSYRRFIQMYATTVYGLDSNLFTEKIEAAKAFMHGDLDVPTLKKIVKVFKKTVEDNGKTIPQDVHEQLYGAILSVFGSWYAPKAKSYRKIENIPEDIGTAVNIQRMVFGNMNDQSGTGVAFTRDPNTGENVKYGDFLINAQGEDVVDGSHVTMPLTAMGNHFPEQYEELCNYMGLLENTFRDMCDIEFTIEDGKLFMLQTRIGKRNPQAAIAMAFDMHNEGLIDRETAINRISSVQGPKKQDGVFNGVHIGTGMAASPGKVFGKATFNAQAAVAAQENGEDVILIRQETSPCDVEGMAAAVGILTAKGGLVSHAAVVARGWGKPCVVGLDSMNVASNLAKIGSHVIKEGDMVAIDGTTGEVFYGS